MGGESVTTLPPWPLPIYDTGVSNDKYVNTVLHKNCATKFLQHDEKHCEVFNLWKSQSKYDFGFVPLSDLIMPESSLSGNKIDCPIQQHFHVRASSLSNFMCQRTPVVSQLHIEDWKVSLSDYWDQQLLLLIQYGFPLDFDRNCPL